MKVAVIGAGIAGLAAARTLQKAGHTATIYESNDQPGGRCSTLELQGFVFDIGATSIAPRGRELETVMLDELDQDGLTLVKKPIYIHASLRVSPGDPYKNKIERYCYISGNQTLPRLIAENCEVRLSHPIREIGKIGNRFVIEDEEFEAVIVAVPTPQAVEILASCGDLRLLQSSRFRPCLSVSLGYSIEIDDLPYHAVLDPEQRHPLVWLSIESLKCSGRAPAGCTAMVAQLGPSFSQQHFEAEDDAILGATVDYIVRLYGQAWGTPTVFDIKRWKYSQPENVALFESVNNPGSRLLLAGDGLIGGRTEYAYSSGVRAANMLIGKSS